MRHEVPRKNWTTALADIIEKANDGDEILVHSYEMQQLGERAQARMCPNKYLMFVIQGKPVTSRNVIRQKPVLGMK